MTWRVVRAAEHRAQAWKNGGGTTVELATSGDTPFRWRASLAEVASSGPFSDFAGYDRFLVLLEGEGFTLRFPDGERVLDRSLATLAFDGGAPCTATLRGGPSTDWNWMVARAHLHGALSVVHAPGPLAGRVWFAVAPAVVAIGAYEIALDRRDSVVAPDGAAGRLVSGGPVIAAEAVPLTPR